MNTDSVQNVLTAATTAARIHAPWQRLRELFDLLCVLPPPQRAQRLALESVDAATAQELHELLAQHDAAESQDNDFLNRPAPMAQAWGPEVLLPAPNGPMWQGMPTLPTSVAAATSAVTTAGSTPPAPAAHGGLRLGPWRLIGLLGSGGMGQVWDAERDDGAFEARAAIKLLPAELSRTRPAQAEALLQREQRALARLAHPHIARLLDAGRSADGRAYFVMEAVDGRPIDQACQGQPLAQRLTLFLQLTDAVSHAHRHGLVHCDLKPANVLVTAEGSVKLLDFGIAQALRGATARKGPAPLTPAYASPEQARGESATAASDVYALGVMLYLLLTGQRPYGQQAGNTHAMLQAVLHERPQRPSDAVTAGTGVPAQQLRGDLDAIVAKALAKTVDQRYADVQALAADLRAVLEQRPVAARQPARASAAPAGSGAPGVRAFFAHGFNAAAYRGYTALRFFQRHRTSSAALALATLAVAGALGATAWQARDAVAALALAALGVGLGVSTWQARLAARARDHAQTRLAHTSTLVREVLMRYADLATYLPGGQRMKADLLTDTIAHLERLRIDAGADAELAGELAKAHARLADMQLPGQDTTLEQPDEARAHAEAALTLFAQGEAAHHHDPSYAMWWARAWRVRQKMQRLDGQAQAALETAHRLHRFLRAALQRHPGDATLRAELGSVLLNIGQTCDTWIEPSLNRSQPALTALAEAESLYTELARERPEDGDARFQLGTVAGAQSIVLLRQGRLTEAADAGRRGLRWREEALALQPGHTSYREGLAGESSNLALVLMQIGTPQAAEEALAITTRGDELMQALQAEDPNFATWTQRRRWFALHRGRALLALGRAAEALPVLELALLAMPQPTGTQLQRRALCELAIAQSHAALGQPTQARAVAQRAAQHLHDFLADMPGDAQASDLLQQATSLIG